MFRGVLTLLVVPVLALTGCAAAPRSAGDRVRVVASTDVWGDVVQQVGGSAVQVVSLIDDPAQDPHEYQASARDQLAVSRARVVVVNGGGYDDFLSALLEHRSAGTAVVDAVDASGIDRQPASGELNEHLWYDLPAVAAVAGAVARAVVAAAPTKRAAVQANLRAFTAALHRLELQEQRIAAHAAGRGVAITEPVPLYMTAALGLVNRTPAAFSEAVEDGRDVAPAVLRQELALLSGRRVSVLAVNLQTTDATTDRVVAAARRAGVPVVGVRETLPAGLGYLPWMRRDLAAFEAALR